MMDVKLKKKIKSTKMQIFCVHGRKFLLMRQNIIQLDQANKYTARCFDVGKRSHFVAKKWGMDQKSSVFLIHFHHKEGQKQSPGKRRMNVPEASYPPHRWNRREKQPIF